MRLWPFGSDDDSSDVESISRVVAGRPRDGATVRAKLSLHFEGPVPQSEADEQADIYATRLKQRFEEAATGAELLGAEPELSSELGGPRASATAAIRGVEVVALHLVGVNSAPPPPRRRSTPPPSLAMGRRSGSSSQMLAVRGDILVQPGATPESAGLSLAPLLRDVKTRVLIGILRNYDLVVLRRVEPDEEMLNAMVPQSTAALGRFAESRAEELDKWQSALGPSAMRHLRREAAAIACLYFERALEHQAVDPTIAEAVLAQAAAQGLESGLPVERMRRYASHGEDAIALELASSLAQELTELSDHDAFARAMVPVLVSLEADFVFAASQVKISVVS